MFPSMCVSSRKVRVETGHRGRRESSPLNLETKSEFRAVVISPADYSSISDETLLSRYRDNRRPEDFDEIVRRHYTGLSHYLNRYLNDTALADDVLQDTLLLIHSKCDLYRDGLPARSWIYSVAFHRAVDVLRRARRLRMVNLDSSRRAEESGSLIEQLPGVDLSPLDELELQERSRWVQERLARLPDRLRMVMEMSYFQGQSYAEIADHLHIPVGTVKSRLHSAMGKLRASADHSHLVGSL